MSYNQSQFFLVVDGAFGQLAKTGHLHIAGVSTTRHLLFTIRINRSWDTGINPKNTKIKKPVHCFCSTPAQKRSFYIKWGYMPDINRHVYKTTPTPQECLLPATVLWFCRISVSAERGFERLELDMLAAETMVSKMNTNATCWVCFVIICLCHCRRFVILFTMCKKLAWCCCRFFWNVCLVILLFFRLCIWLAVCSLSLQNIITIASTLT